MKIVRQKQQAEASESPLHHSMLAQKRAANDTALDRAAVADAIIRKMSYGTYRVRANLQKWLKSEQKVTKFDLATLKKFGLLTEAQINGKLGAEMKALRKANQEIFLGLVQFPVGELQKYYELMSQATIQKRYGRRIDDRDIPVVVVLKDDAKRQIDAPSKKETYNWLRSKQNREVREATAPIREAIKAREMRTKKNRKKKIRESISDYVSAIKNFGAYVEQGLKQRRKWMNALEKRTGLTQKMHNSD